MAEKTAKYQLIVAVLLALITIGNIFFMYASRPTAELQITVKEHSSKIEELQFGKTTNMVNIANLKEQLEQSRDDNKEEHKTILNKLDDIAKAVK